MKRYRNLAGHSGVVAYEIGAESIAVRFDGGDVYEYDYARPGRAHVEEMKRRAEAGQGLSTYIAQHVREAYAGKRPAR